MASSPAAGPSRALSLDEYVRYGRQMIMPDCGLPGQVELKRAVVAVIGAGGLGCPVLQYLGGAGVGEIHVIDHDSVGVSNLHRQVLHSTDRVGMNKAESAAVALGLLNPNVRVIARAEPITSTNALDLLRPCHIVVDCTDRPATRYLLNDAAVRLGIPLVSGAAITNSGQWAVHGGRDGKGKQRACYRCLWPAVLPGSSGRCEELGVWGFVTGMVGVCMASEVIKIILDNQDPDPLLHLIHFGGNPLVRSIRMRPPSVKCIACGPNPIINDDLASTDYDAFCHGITDEPDVSSGLVVGEPDHRISAKALAELLGNETMVLIDTRSPTEFGICSIPGSSNRPLSEILEHPQTVAQEGQDIVFVCRLGNDSQEAAAALRRTRQQSASGEESHYGSVRDVRGGLRAWARDVDPSFPLY